LGAPDICGLAHPLTILLIVITCLVSLAAFKDERLFARLLFDPYRTRHGQWFRFLSHALVHTDMPHLVVNMFVLYMFGRNVELLYGMVLGQVSGAVFLLLYLGGAVMASVPAFVKHGVAPGYRAVGASGAVSAVLFAQILLMPTAPVSFLFIPFDVPSFVFGGLYLFYSWYMDRRGADNVAHDAHLHGALFGIAFTAVVEPRALFDLGSFERYWTP
jgi:membrane associated rhomboid family serine protease